MNKPVGLQSASSKKSISLSTRVIRRLVYGTLFACCFSSSMAQSVAPLLPDAYQPVVGQAHPDFEFPEIATGSLLRLSDLRGQKVVLIHFASW